MGLFSNPRMSKSPRLACYATVSSAKFLFVVRINARRPDVSIRLQRQFKVHKPRSRIGWFECIQRHPLPCRPSGSRCAMAFTCN